MTENNPFGYKRGPLATKTPVAAMKPITVNELNQPCPTDIYQEYCRCWHIYCDALTSPEQHTRTMLATILNMHVPKNVTVFQWPGNAPEVIWIFERPSDRIQDTFQRFSDAIKSYELYKSGDTKTLSIIEESLRNTRKG